MNTIEQIQAYLVEEEGYDSWEEFHRRNNSEIGPNGLLRHKVTGNHCVGHGDGTYDYIKGVFS